MQLPFEELKKIPYLDHANIGHRTIPTLCFFVDGKWKMWVPTEKELVYVEPVDSFEIAYLAKERASSDDLYVSYLVLFYQYASFPPLIKPLEDLRDDLLNIGASLTKFEILFQAGKNQEMERRWDMRRMVQTEMEYLVTTCKSVFDLFQELLSIFWESVSIVDPNITKKSLPDKFRKMVADGETLLDQSQIKEKHQLPDKLAECFAKNGPFFMRLRKIRDGVVHLGNPVSQTIFNTEYGFAVVKDSRPFDGLGLWHTGFELPNNLVSLRPVLAYLVLNTFQACEELTFILSRTIRFYPPLAPDFRIFLRGAHVREFLQLRETMEKCLWWKEAPR